MLADIVMEEFGKSQDRHEEEIKKIKYISNLIQKEYGSLCELFGEDGQGLREMARTVYDSVKTAADNLPSYFTNTGNMILSSSSNPPYEFKLGWVEVVDQDSKLLQPTEKGKEVYKILTEIKSQSSNS